MSTTTWIVVEVSAGEPMVVLNADTRQDALEQYARWAAEREVTEGEQPDYNGKREDLDYGNGMETYNGGFAWDEQGWQLYIIPTEVTINAVKQGGGIKLGTPEAKLTDGQTWDPNA